MVFAGRREAAWGTGPQAWRLIGLLSLLSAAGTPRFAAAQPMDEPVPVYWVAPSEPAPPVSAPRLPQYTLTLRNPDPNLEWAIYPRRGDIDIASPLAECSDATCHITLPRGTYRLAATPLDNRPLHRPAHVGLYEDRELVVRPAHPHRARAGLLVAIAGGVLYNFGGVCLMWAMVNGLGGCEGRCVDSGTLIAVGVSLELTGVVAGVGGLFYFRHHRRPRLVPTREPSPPNGVE